MKTTGNLCSPLISSPQICRQLDLPVDPRLAQLREAGRLFLVRGEDGGFREMALRGCTELGVDPETKAVDITASDETVDRYGDVIVAAGWQLENYGRNPVILVDHNYRVSAIVGTGEPRIKGKKLKIRITHDDDEANENARMVIRLQERGLLRSVSVGFLPFKWELIEDKKGEWTGGFRYLEQELLEVSWVAVPANPNAVLSLGQDITPAADPAGDSTKLLLSSLGTRILAAAAAMR